MRVERRKRALERVILELRVAMHGCGAPDVASLAGLALRVERETLRRFPGTSCVLFGIRTYVTPLSTAALYAATVASRLPASTPICWSRPMKTGLRRKPPGLQRQQAPICRQPV